MQPLRLVQSPDFEATPVRTNQTKTFGQTVHRLPNKLMLGALRQNIFGHRAVSGPLATRHRHQATATYQNRMLPTQTLGVAAFIIRRLHQWPQTDPNAFNVFSCGCLTQITG